MKSYVKSYFFIAVYLIAISPHFLLPLYHSCFLADITQVSTGRMASQTQNNTYVIKVSSVCVVVGMIQVSSGNICF